jgi:hypothetical protein
MKQLIKDILEKIEPRIKIINISVYNYKKILNTVDVYLQSVLKSNEEILVEFPLKINL